MRLTVGLCRNGDVVSINVTPDGKGLHIQDNHPAGSVIGENSTIEGETPKDGENK